MKANHNHATIKCPKCSGAGRLEITIPYVLTLRALKSLGGQPTIAEVHKATNERGVSPYATVQRVRRMADFGLVKLLKDTRPMRVELVG